MEDKTVYTLVHRYYDNSRWLALRSYLTREAAEYDISVFGPAIDCGELVIVETPMQDPPP